MPKSAIWYWIGFKPLVCHVLKRKYITDQKAERAIFCEFSAIQMQKSGLLKLPGNIKAKMTTELEKVNPELFKY